MLSYSDGTQAKVGDVVVEGGRTERYIVLGFDGTFARLLMIGTVVKDDEPRFGKTIVLPSGFTRNAPVSLLNRLGYAGITIEQD